MALRGTRRDRISQIDGPAGRWLARYLPDFKPSFRRIFVALDRLATRPLPPLAFLARLRRPLMRPAYLRWASCFLVSLDRLRLAFFAFLRPMPSMRGEPGPCT